MSQTYLALPEKYLAALQYLVWLRVCSGYVDTSFYKQQKKVKRWYYKDNDRTSIIIHKDDKKGK